MPSEDTGNVLPRAVHHGICLIRTCWAHAPWGASVHHLDYAGVATGRSRLAPAWTKPLWTSLRLVEIEAQHLRPTPDHDQPHRRAQRVPQLPTRRGRHAQLIETVTSFQNHVSPLLPTPDNLGVTHGHSGETDARKPHHHCRFSRRSDVFLPDSRREGVSRVRVRLPPLPRLPTETQGDLSRRRVPDAPFALCPYPSEWGDHLAHPVHDVSCGIHRPAAFRLAVPPDAPRGGSRRLAGHPRWSQSGMVRGDLPPLADGALSPGLCIRPPQSGDGLDPMWLATPRL